MNLVCLLLQVCSIFLIALVFRILFDLNLREDLGITGIQNTIGSGNAYSELNNVICGKLAKEKLRLTNCYLDRYHFAVDLQMVTALIQTNISGDRVPYLEATNSPDVKALLVQIELRKQLNSQVSAVVLFSEETQLQMIAFIILGDMTLYGDEIIMEKMTPTINQVS
ncbi:hypothetical protein EG68_10334 [Paragonimus skrjabini miyazakii]|uniref:Uncharacterized protein n=1 Tax=Paragonimus skrjabini miyazakii TaxID=59628 RepID=A0A8S9YDL6_9TREM|nr:hypothetical protein EG68_10334 [Paragonimus skrjabini miyazakii]